MGEPLTYVWAIGFGVFMGFWLVLEDRRRWYEPVLIALWPIGLALLSAQMVWDGVAALYAKGEANP